MVFFYIDESGDLGFDFSKIGTSRFFNITVLVIKSIADNQQVIGAIKKTVKRKIVKQKKQWKKFQEIKGSNSRTAVKKFLYDQIKDIDFEIYSAVLDKKKAYSQPSIRPDRIYKHIAYQVVSLVEANLECDGIEVVIDKSVYSREHYGLNDAIISGLEGKFSFEIPMYIKHLHSHEVPGLQTVDIFAHGIMRKYELEDVDWYNVFREKIRKEKLII